LVVKHPLAVEIEMFQGEHGLPGLEDDFVDLPRQLDEAKKSASK